MLYLLTLAAGLMIPIILMVAMVWRETKRWTHRLVLVAYALVSAGVMIYAVWWQGL